MSKSLEEIWSEMESIRLDRIRTEKIKEQKNHELAEKQRKSQIIDRRIYEKSFISTSTSTSTSSAGSGGYGSINQRLNENEYVDNDYIDINYFE